MQGILGSPLLPHFIINRIEASGDVYCNKTCTEMLKIVHGSWKRYEGGLSNSLIFVFFLTEYVYNNRKENLGTFKIFETSLNNYFCYFLNVAKTLNSSQQILNFSLNFYTQRIKNFATK